MKQSLKPQQTIIVDDGSTDGTLDVVSKYNDGSFQIVKRPTHEKGDINRVPYVIRDGSALLDEEFDYVAILDADTVLEENYYLELTKALALNPRIGIAGGKIVNQPETGLIFGIVPYVYGCNRVYTRECWLKINDGKIMKPVPSWDTYHNLYARMLGFFPTRFEDVKSWSLRLARTSTQFQKGYAAYQLGYQFWYLLGRSSKSLAPSMLAGWLKASLLNEQQYPVKIISRQLQIHRIRSILRRFS
jgi:glycosyltransferase involved in cell wall biosynthesis